VASVYDPLGFLAPFILEGKRILQDICKSGYTWDDPLDDDLKGRWRTWESGLAELEKISIPRCLFPPDFGKVVQKELHHFCDASRHSFGQCSYLRSINSEGRVHVTLLSGKSRVLPIDKAITIPRAELQAAVLSSKLAANLRTDLSLDSLDNEFFWSDSEIVLGYIQNKTTRYHQFVSNRIQQIHDLTNPKQWHHISGNLNPSDIASRGSSISSLNKSTWFQGPAFLWENDLSNMLSIQNFTVLQNDPEVKSTCHSTAATSKAFDLSHRLSKFSTLNSAIRGLTALKKIQRNYHKHPNAVGSNLVEKSKSKIEIVSKIQLEDFGNEYNIIKAGCVPENNNLAKLDPFIDNHGILRVGGRLQNSNLPFEEKHPIILTKTSVLSKLIINQCHMQVQHQGRGMTIAEARSLGYWIIGVNRLTSSIIHSCVICRRVRAEPVKQKMSALPAERITPSPPFTAVATDCFGPFVVKQQRKEVKRYGVLFTCLASRAIHIEVVDDLSTDAFINALRCFIAIRGPIRKLYSDRGTNFVGAANEFSAAKVFANNQNFEWEFNTPHASHMGGVWERQIRTIRSILNSMLATNSNRLDIQTLRTLFYEIMAIINSRPLSTETEDGTPLTPNHLLTMKSKIILPPPGQFDESDTYSRKRWRVVQSLANQFWSKWRKNYIANLQPRQKWLQQTNSIITGDIVLLSDDNTSRCSWR